MDRESRIIEHMSVTEGLDVVRPLFTRVAAGLPLPARPKWEALTRTLEAFGVASMHAFVVSSGDGVAVLGGLVAVVTAPTILGGPDVLDVLAVAADTPADGAALIRWARKTAARLDLAAVVWHVPTGTLFDVALRERGTEVLETAYLDRI